MTGISSEASVVDQFGILKELLGAGKNVGVIYDPKETGSIISEAVPIAGKSGFNLIKTEVGLESEVASALTGMVDKINALWIVPDSTVVTKGSEEDIALLEMVVEIFVNTPLERKRAEERIKHHVQRLTALHTIRQSLISSLDLHVILSIFLEQVKGVLEIFHRSPLNPDHEWLGFLEAIGALAAIAIDNASLFEGM